MEIKSASYINLSDIASLLGLEYSDMCEYYDTKYTWGDMIQIWFPVCSLTWLTNTNLISYVSLQYYIAGSLRNGLFEFPG